jgi:hypothetical protein
MVSLGSDVQVGLVSSSNSVNIENSLYVCSPTSLYTVLQGYVGMPQGDYRQAEASIGSLVSWLAQ